MLDPLLAQPAPIPLHAIAALLAIALASAQFALPKGGMLHKIMGRLWVLLMIVICLTSFFIHEVRLIGLFSPIHLLSIFTLFALVRAVQYARKGDIKRHRRIMQNLTIFALIITGLFTLLPGRVMHSVLFGA